MEENKKRRKRDIVKEAVSDSLHKAKETVLFPYQKAVTKLKEVISPSEHLNWDKNMHIVLKCFYATNNATIAQTYLDGQRGVLQEFKVSGVSSSKNHFWENDNSFFIIAQDIRTMEVVAGMRIDIADKDHKLPLEDALSVLYPDISIRVHRFDYRIGETCALWLKKEYSERRLPMHITNACIAIATKLRVQVLVALVNEYSLKMALRSGFTIASTVGNNGGKFYYPTAEYLSTVIELDTVSLNTLQEKDRQFIIDLRNNPVHTIYDNYKGYQTRIDYDLRII